jgi:hypothetical protein
MIASRKPERGVGSIGFMSLIPAYNKYLPTLILAFEILTEKVLASLVTA